MAIQFRPRRDLPKAKDIVLKIDKKPIVNSNNLFEELNNLVEYHRAIDKKNLIENIKKTNQQFRESFINYIKFLIAETGKTYYKFTLTRELVEKLSKYNYTNYCVVYLKDSLNEFKFNERFVLTNDDKNIFDSLELRYIIQIPYNVIHLDFGKEINKNFKDIILNSEWKNIELPGPNKHFNKFRLLNNEQNILEMLND